MHIHQDLYYQNNFNNAQIILIRLFRCGRNSEFDLRSAGIYVQFS